jgi:iron complex transport system substrate-binding protein
MREMLACILAMVLLAFAVPLLITSAGAQEAGIPCDDGDNELTKAELVNAILPYMLDEGAYTLDEVGDAAWVYAYWDGEPKQITDSADRTVTIYKPVERMIPLSDPHADVLRVLEAENNVVGVTTDIAKEEILLPTMCKQPSVGSGWSPDFEKIIERNPDIVLHYVTWAPELEEKLEPTGINVIRLDFTKPENIIEEFEKLGYILDKEDKSEEFISWYEGYTDTIKSRTEELSEEQKPRVYMELYPNIWENKAFGGGSSGDQQCKMAGGINIASELPSTARDVDPEWVAWEDPDIIIQVVTSKAPSGYDVDDISGVKAVREADLSKPEFQNITAIKNGDVFVMASDIRCGIQMVISDAYWAKWFNSTLFEDLDPHEIQKEYIDRFQRIDYDLDKHGVFVYHPELHPAGK